MALSDHPEPHKAALMGIVKQYRLTAGDLVDAVCELVVETYKITCADEGITPTEWRVMWNRITNVSDDLIQMVEGNTPNPGEGLIALLLSAAAVGNAYFRSGMNHRQ